MKNVLVLLGAAIGGAVGYFIFIWLTHQGLYGLIIPGGAVGLGAGFFKSKSPLIGVVCGMMALALGLFAEWRFAPFVADASLGYFLTHVPLLQPMTLVMIGVGAAIGFWIPFRRAQDAAKIPCTPDGK